MAKRKATKKAKKSARGRKAARGVKAAARSKKTATKKRATKRGAAKKTKRAAPKRKAKARVKKAPVEAIGEGSYAASRQFQKDEQTFVKKNRKRIPALAREAETALEGPEGPSLIAATEEASLRTDEAA